MSVIDTEIRAAAGETDPTVTHEAAGETYTIRRFENGDKTGVLDLHGAIDGMALGGSSAWFDWKFVDNPALVHTPIFVAEHEGAVVGARPFVAFRLRAGPRTAIGIQTADTMVHPEHRSRGLFSRLNDLAFAYYEQREPELMFSIPNSRSRPAYLDLGARVVSPIRSFIRLQTPSKFVAEKLGDWVPSRTGSVLDGLTKGYLGLRDRRHNGAGEISVERRATVPSETLAQLGTAEIPSEIHAARTTAFYDWRFENPVWEYDTFVASRDGEPFAAMVTGTRQTGERVVTRIVDAVPLAGEQRLAGFAAILGRICEVHAESDVLVFGGSGIPSDLLQEFGFQPDDQLPLSPIASRTVLITMALGDSDPEWTLEGQPIADPESWQLPFCERNTG